MDDAVLAAQRAYGAFLAAGPGADRQAGRDQARQRYRTLVARAEAGDESAQTELARILAEPTTLSDVDVDPVEVLVCVPGDWCAELLRRNYVGVPSLIRLVEQLEQRHGDSRAVLRYLSEIAHRNRDTETLRWAYSHGGERLQQEIFDLLGRLLVDIANGLVHLPIQDQQGLINASRVVKDIDIWLQDAPRLNAEPTLVARLTNLRATLNDRQAYDEGIVLLNRLRRSFLSPVTELATWTNRVEHLCRLTEDWRSINGRAIHLAGLHDDLAAECARARNNARQWGQRNMAPSGFGPGQVLPSPPGSCPYCVSWLGDTDYCTQCGARL